MLGEDEEDLTSAKKLHLEIKKRAKIGGGEAIATLNELPMITPRGKYSLDMYQTFLKFHGRTHDYKILYRNINRAFLLPKPDGVHMAFVIALNTPVKQGNTYFPFLVLQFHKATEELTTINLPESALKQTYPDLDLTIQGPLFEIVSRLFKSLIQKMRIIVPGHFKSHYDSKAIRSSIKASEGLLYPLEKSFLFINKPVVFIRTEDIAFVEFARVEALQTNRSFDLVISTKRGDNFQFTGIDRNEYKPILQFLQRKNIHIKNLDSHTKKAQKQVFPISLSF